MREGISKDKFTVRGVVFPGFEMLDLFGPFELFSVTGHFNLSILGLESGAISSSRGPKVVVDFPIKDVSELDILLVPGGAGTRPMVQSIPFMDGLVSLIDKSKWITSVCTGSALLAKTGVLDGKRATSNKNAFTFAESQSDQVLWQKCARWVEDDNCFTSSGVSAGMDMSLAIIAKLLGRNMALEAAQKAEYIWNEDPNNDPFAI